MENKRKWYQKMWSWVSGLKPVWKVAIIVLVIGIIIIPFTSSEDTPVDKSAEKTSKEKIVKNNESEEEKLPTLNEQELTVYMSEINDIEEEYAKSGLTWVDSTSEAITSSEASGQFNDQLQEIGSSIDMMTAIINGKTNEQKTPEFNTLNSAITERCTFIVDTIQIMNYTTLGAVDKSIEISNKYDDPQTSNQETKQALNDALEPFNESVE
ncbi:ribonuclease BN [Listeria monocytogenes]|nr:ribonuclease BN [Listeria monocytogenes]MCH4926132.1 ribonuclease BN [Listeria monocytogenes]MCW4401082.1 ribonuclease BN [Listeria monocytogenes]MCW4431042.1 ribonuclease BN [Listeria monocytogenes]MDA5988544.1 ribonuclease BN [Listeria monocytogenes]MDE8594319.1 ribonuclease BN [Listeria monocytogenes]